MRKSTSRVALLSLLWTAVLCSSYGQGNVRKAEIAANEVSAKGSVRTLLTALITYQSTYGRLPGSLSYLGPGSTTSASHADLVDGGLASGIKSGYVFTYKEFSADEFFIHADPIKENYTGNLHFLANQTGSIRECHFEDDKK